MLIDLPENLVHQILMRLPVKSLLRFRCVCKSWYSLISSSYFIYSHLHITQHHNINNLLLLSTFLIESKKEVYSIHADNEQFQQIETLDFPLEGFSIVGCVNGLICLTKFTWKYNVIVLWNPFIRKYFTLSSFKELSLLSRNDFCAFGYDASSNDFKVLMVIRCAEDLVCSIVRVYSLNAKSWRTLDCAPPKGVYLATRNVGNFVYILLGIESSREYEIVSFDLNAEVFTVISYPPELVSAQYFPTIELSIFRGSLALVVQLDGDEYESYHIWVMRGDGMAKSWFKLFSVDIKEDMFYWQVIAGFIMNGTMLVFGDCDVFVSHGADDIQVVKYELPRFSEPKAELHLYSYKESLVLLQEGDDQPLLPP